MISYEYITLYSMDAIRLTFTCCFFLWDSFVLMIWFVFFSYSSSGKRISQGERGKVRIKKHTQLLIFCFFLINVSLLLLLYSIIIHCILLLCATFVVRFHFINLSFFVLFCFVFLIISFPFKRLLFNIKYYFYYKYFRYKV